MSTGSEAPKAGICGVWNGPGRNDDMLYFDHSVLCVELKAVGCSARSQRHDLAIAVQRGVYQSCIPLDEANDLVFRNVAIRVVDLEREPG